MIRSFCVGVAVTMMRLAPPSRRGVNTSAVRRNDAIDPLVTMTTLPLARNTAAGVGRLPSLLWLVCSLARCTVLSVCLHVCQATKDDRLTHTSEPIAKRARFSRLCPCSFGGMTSSTTH
jgi:hypothetical protein